MNEFLLKIEFNVHTSYQHQIREKLVELISLGQFGDGVLPSSRKMAQQLGVSRNTVVHVYESLVQEEYLVSRERSGFYVNPEIFKEPCVDSGQEKALQKDNAPNWCSRFASEPSTFATLDKDKAWMGYKYPFIYGKIEVDDFPISQWRECVRASQSRSSLHEWVAGYIDDDDPELITQIRQQVLSKRGIVAQSDEILMTMGTLNSFFLLALLLSKKSSVVGIEDPGWPDLHHIFRFSGAQTKIAPVDDEGLIIGEGLDRCDYVCVTPSHHYPTTATMTMNRRKALLRHACANDVVIIEDDYDSEMNFSDAALPALKSLDTTGRVIYTSSLSKSISPGLRIGYLVADKEVIRELRALRRLNYRYPPSNNQRAISHFIAQGYYDSHGRRMRRIYKEKWSVMEKGVKQYFHNCNVKGVLGSFCFWVELPLGVPSQLVVEKAAELSILVESGDSMFVNPSNKKEFIRIGYTAIPMEKITEGLSMLGQLIIRLSNK